MTTESEVNKLADHLLSKGLAMTKNSALDMAKEISSTSKKVNKGIDDAGKERDVPAETSAEAAKARRDNIERMRRNALNSKPVQINADYEIPGIRKDATLEEIQQGKGGSDSEEAEQKEDPLVNQVEKAEKPAVPASQPKDVSSMAESKVDLNDVFKFR